MQVLQPFFKILHNLNTLPGWSKGYDIFFARSLPISENINSSLLFVLNFWTSKVREQKLPFGYILVVETGKTYPGVDASFHFSKLRQEVNAQ